MKKNNEGFILPIVIGIMLVILILMPALVRWIQQDANMAVKDQKRTMAFNLAEAGIDRGVWKLQSTTTTWTTASLGTVIAGYNFDTTYSDITGGTYRIKFSSGPASNQVTIYAEGRDSGNKETRQLKEVVQNQTIYSALMSRGTVTWGKGLCVFWGPIMSQGNITMDAFTSTWYFPRKFAKGVVTGTAGNLRDTNGLISPNTDNVEWWSDYDGVPELPILDFAALRSSAEATGTLNVYGCYGTQGAGSLGNATKWDTRGACSQGNPHATHFGNPWSHPKSARISANPDYVWYWDTDVVLAGAGSSNQSCGLRGTVVVRGNLTIDTPGEYEYLGHVPTDAWEEENKLLVGTFDTSASSEYPADTGLHSSASTHDFGTTTFKLPGLGSTNYHATVGIKGFTYVGGNLTITNYLDFHGAVWVNGSVIASGGDNSHFCGIFYDDTLRVPALNVILIRQSWNEVPPNTTTPWL